jgi:hypothetical protein
VGVIFLDVIAILGMMVMAFAGIGRLPKGRDATGRTKVAMIGIFIK